MDMSKRVAAAVSGLMFAGAAALTVATAGQANAAIESAAPQGCHVKWCWKRPARPGGDNGGGGGGGGGTNFYNPNQNYNPVTAVDEVVA